jgi:lysophospholipase L1-like esterase
VILASCLPAGGFGWRPEIKDAMEKVTKLNARVKEYADKNKIPYVDYFSALVSADGKEMNPDYATDYPAIHPNAKGYEVMEGLLLPVIKKMR